MAGSIGLMSRWQSLRLFALCLLGCIVGAVAGVRAGFGQCNIPGIGKYADALTIGPTCADGADCVRFECSWIHANCGDMCFYGPGTPMCEPSE